MIWHWLNTELWGPMWPNMFAPSFVTLVAVVVSHLKRTRQAEHHHQAMKDHIAAVAGTSAGPAMTTESVT